MGLVDTTLHGGSIIFYIVAFIHTNFFSVVLVFFLKHCCTQICLCSNQGSPSQSQHYILLCQDSPCGRTWAGPAHKTFLSSPPLPFLRGDIVWRVLPHQMWQHPTPRGLPATCSLRCNPSHPISPGHWRHLSSFTHAEHSTDSYATLTANQPGKRGLETGKGSTCRKGRLPPTEGFLKLWAEPLKLWVEYCSVLGKEMAYKDVI